MPTSSRFDTTHWSIVFAAARGSTAASADAMAALCSSYWYPLYCYVRKKGYSQPDAQDLTQSFFTRLLEKNYIKQADPQLGRFRSFLLTSLKHFLANEWDRDHTVKRGGRTVTLSLDYEGAETRYEFDSVSTLTPEKLYEKRWATALVDRAISKLAEDFNRAGKSTLFARLRGFLVEGGSGEPYRSVAIDLGMSEAAVKVAVHRLRRQFRQRLRAEIADTVSSQAEVEDEIRYLLSTLGS